MVWTRSGFVIDKPVKVSSVPTLIEQIHLVTRYGLIEISRAMRKQLIQRGSLEECEAEDL